MSNHLIGSLTPLVVIIIILAIRLPRMLKGRRLRLETHWIRSAIFIALGAVSIAATPPRNLIEIAILVAATAFGGAVGWQQARMMTIGIEPDSHQLNVKASPVAVTLFAGLIVVRFGLREVLSQDGGRWGLNTGLVLDGLIALVVGLYVVQSVEMYLRAVAMLREAKASGVKIG